MESNKIVSKCSDSVDRENNGVKMICLRKCDGVDDVGAEQDVGEGSDGSWFLFNEEMERLTKFRRLFADKNGANNSL